MSNWWESKDGAGGWDADKSAAGTDDKWKSPEQVHQAAAAPSTDPAKKIEQLRGGKWTDDWSDFLYWDDATSAWTSSEKDESLGKKGWWKFLYHEGKEWQPEDLAKHLEEQLGTSSSAPTDAWAAAANPGGYAAAAAPADPWAAAANPASAPAPTDSWATAAAAPAATDSWATAAAAPAADDTWGSWSKPAEEAKTDSWPVPNAKAFWEMQKWNVQGGALSKKTEEELEQDEHHLFDQHLRSNAGVDFSAYDNVPVEVSGNKATNIPMLSTFEEIYSTFKEMIPEVCVQNVRRCGYQVPTPVQKYAVPVGLAGRDVMCCAQTGSGKTAAYLIPTIGLMMKHHEKSIGDLDVPFEGVCSPDTLIMAPTRELAIQIHEEALKFCHRTGYRCCRVYGGEATKIQLEDLSKGCDLMVATPGRLQDFIDRGVIAVSATYVLVLDEADRMLDMGFEKAVRDIVQNHDMPQKDGRQTMMFSATFPEECQRMAQDFLWDYIWIGVGVVGGAVTTVTQTLEKVNPKAKYEKLIEVLDKFYSDRSADQRALVFVNAKDTAKWLDEQLYEQSYDTGALHGNLTQTERETNLSRYRKGEIDVMVATDVAARGLDIEKVDLVVNYDMPNEVDTYVHRIGRSGRIGNKGHALTFIATDESDKPFENLEILSKLLTIMKDAGSSIPDWLDEQVNYASKSWDDDKPKDSWANWGGKDMRATADWWDKKDNTQT